MDSLDYQASGGGTYFQQTPSAVLRRRLDRFAASSMRNPLISARQRDCLGRTRLKHSTRMPLLPDRIFAAKPWRPPLFPRPQTRPSPPIRIIHHTFSTTPSSPTPIPSTHPNNPQNLTLFSQATPTPSPPPPPPTPQTSPPSRNRDPHTQTPALPSH